MSTVWQLNVHTKGNWNKPTLFFFCSLHFSQKRKIEGDSIYIRHSLLMLEVCIPFGGAVLQTLVSVFMLSSGFCFNTTLPCGLLHFLCISTIKDCTFTSCVASQLWFKENAVGQVTSALFESQPGSISGAIWCLPTPVFSCVCFLSLFSNLLVLIQQSAKANRDHRRVKPLHWWMILAKQLKVHNVIQHGVSAVSF